MLVSLSFNNSFRPMMMLSPRTRSSAKNRMTREEPSEARQYHVAEKNENDHRTINTWQGALFMICVATVPVKAVLAREWCPAHPTMIKSTLF